MAKVIKFDSVNPQYRKDLKSCISMLEAFETEIYSAMVNLAADGPWREWNDGKQVGDVAEITPEMLGDTDDRRIQLLLELHAKLIGTTDALEAAFPSAE